MAIVLQCACTERIKQANGARTEYNCDYSE